MIDFTQGIWEYDPRSGFIFSKNSDNNNEATIAVLVGHDVPFASEFSQSIANARLITAAPVLCSLLEYISEYGLSLELCLMAKKLLAYVKCEDINENDFNEENIENIWANKWTPPII